MFWVRIPLPGAAVEDDEDDGGNTVAYEESTDGSEEEVEFPEWCVMGLLECNSNATRVPLLA